MDTQARFGASSTPPRCHPTTSAKDTPSPATASSPLFGPAATDGIGSARKDLLAGTDRRDPKTQVELAHDPDYVDDGRSELRPTTRTPRTCSRGCPCRSGSAPSDNPLAPGTARWPRARWPAATAECVRAGRAVVSCATRSIRRAGCTTRPTARASGFCIYNDLDGRASGRRSDLGLAPRVMYVDFDVHHGDGVEFAFERRPEPC